MATDSQHYQELWGGTQALENSQNAQEFFAAVDTAIAEDKLSVDDAYSLRQAALFTLSQATATDPSEAEIIILKYLLPLCVGEPEDAVFKITTTTSAMRELLRDWIDKYQEDRRLILLNTVLKQVCKAVEGARPQPAIWTLSVIGFRSPDVMEVLWKLAERDDAVGDAALSAIAGMGVSGEERQKLLNEIQTRLSKRQATALDFAVQEMPDPIFIDLLSPRVNSDDVSFITGHLLSKIADSAPLDAELQSRIWSIIKGATKTNPQRKQDVIFAGTVGPHCNTKDVIATFGSWIDRNINESLRYVLYLRLEDCVRPTQLEGWGNLVNAELLSILEDDATRNTSAEGQWMTTAHRVKESAWNAAISAGVRAVTGWLENAIVNETNPYSQHSVMETAAALSIPVVPESVAGIIRRELAVDSPTQQTGIFPFIGAAEVAQSSATLQSLDLLLESALTYNGYVLRSTVEAVGDVSAWLIQHGNKDVEAKLCERSLPPNSERVRSLAIGGLREVAVRGMLSAELLPALLQNAEDLSLATHLRARSIETIGLLPRFTVDNAAAARLIKIIPNSENEEEILPAILTAIARQSLWQDHHDIFLPRLQIRREQDKWVLDRASTFKEWQAYALSMLVAEDPEEFGSVAATLVREATAGPVFHLMSSLAGRSDINPISELVDSLADRITKIQTPRSSELSLFDLLGRLVFDIASLRTWKELWINWMPDARVALADAVGRTRTPTVKAIELLKELLSDAGYAVRRAAARALASVDRTALEDHCLLWANSGRTDLRKRAAEASGWLSDGNADPATIPVLRQLLGDPERQVREAAKQSLADSRRRQWADDCMRELERPAVEPNAFIFAAYPYGRALNHLADDVTLKKLQEMSRRYDLAPNIRHWFRQILKESEKQWTKTAREWPQPWLPWSGDIEEMDGEVFSADASHKVHFSFWYRHRETPTDNSDWGGMFLPTKRQSRWFPIEIATTVCLSVPGRTEARALLTNWNTDGSAIFHGTGPYPGTSPG